MQGYDEARRSEVSFLKVKRGEAKRGGSSSKRTEPKERKVASFRALIRINYFIINLHVFSIMILPEQKTIPSSHKLTIPSSSQPRTSKLSKPKYKNANIEKLIADNKDGCELYLTNTGLTDEDMEIVAYYAIQENKVS